jgi:hypothetical protein
MTGRLGLGRSAVARTTLLAVFDALGIEITTYYVIFNTREIRYSPSPNEDRRVFLKVMSLTRDVGVDVLAVAEADSSNFT